jgi:hypothetical protein
VHSAFAFGNESYVAKANIDGSEVAPGALISFVQKGLQYVAIEAHLNNDGTENVCDAPFSLLQPHKCDVVCKKRVFDPYVTLDTDYGKLEVEDTASVVASFSFVQCLFRRST